MPKKPGASLSRLHKILAINNRRTGAKWRKRRNRTDRRQTGLCVLKSAWSQGKAGWKAMKVPLISWVRKQSCWKARNIQKLAGTGIFWWRSCCRTDTEGCKPVLQCKNRTGRQPGRNKKNPATPLPSGWPGNSAGRRLLQNRWRKAGKRWSGR